MSEFRASMRAMIATHCETIRSEAAELLSLMESGGADADRIASAVAQAHKLKGSSGSLGFREISATAQRLEDHLRALCSGDPSATPSRERALALGAELVSLAANLTPERSSLYDAV